MFEDLAQARRARRSRPRAGTWRRPRTPASRAAFRARRPWDHSRRERRRRSMIWSASRANLKPPSGPRWLETSPPRRRSDRIAPRNLAGRSCSWARCSALTDTSLAAKVSSARMAYSVLAGICIPPFCRTAANLERLLGWTSCSPSMTAISISAWGTARISPRSCRPSCAVASTSSSCARRTSTTRRGSPTPR